MQLTLRLSYLCYEWLKHIRCWGSVHVLETDLDNLADYFI